MKGTEQHAGGRLTTERHKKQFGGSTCTTPLTSKSESASGRDITCERTQGDSR